MGGFEKNLSNSKATVIMWQESFIHNCQSVMSGEVGGFEKNLSNSEAT